MATLSKNMHFFGQKDDHNSLWKLYRTYRQTVLESPRYELSIDISFNRQKKKLSQQDRIKATFFDVKKGSKTDFIFHKETMKMHFLLIYDKYLDNCASIEV